MGCPLRDQPPHASLCHEDASLDCRGFAELLAAWRGSDRQSTAKQHVLWDDGLAKGVSELVVHDGSFYLRFILLNLAKLYIT